MVLRQKVPGLAGSFPDKCPLFWISFLFLGVPQDLSGLAAMHVFVLTAGERAGAELIADAFGGCGVCRLPGSACRSSSPCTCSLGLQPGHQQGPQKGHTC